MGKYLKLFENHADYVSYSGGMILPNVSHCITENHVHYNPILPPSRQYLTFDILSDGTITWKRNGGSSLARTIYYSLDNGTNWEEISTSTSAGATINVETGDTLIFKGENTFYGDIADNDNYNYFGGTASFNVSGNILSLCYGDDFAEVIQLPSVTSATYGHFAALFKNSKIVSAKNLVLPLDVTNNVDYTYYRTFDSCTDLVEIPSTLPCGAWYAYTFDNCTSLAETPPVPDWGIYECE